METANDFWGNVAAVNGCLEWQAYVEPNGYGSLTWKGKKQKAHRVALMLIVGPLTKGLLVLHSCDNRKCCNPIHISEGTHRQNMDDMLAKGRQKNSRQTHCVNGHPLSGTNLMQNKRQRRCKICFSESRRASDKKRRANAKS